MAEKRKTRQKSMNPDIREKQVIDLAYDLAERQLMEGTASSAVITHFLKLGTEKAKIEQEMLKNQSQLISAKALSIEHDRDSKDLAAKAIEAIKNYAPSQEL